VKNRMGGHGTPRDAIMNRSRGKKILINFKSQSLRRGGRKPTGYIETQGALSDGPGERDPETLMSEIK